MANFHRKPLNPTRFNQAVQKHPAALFGVPFILLMVGASFALTPFTQTRYDVHDQKLKSVSKEEEIGLDKNRKKFDIREEYFRLSAAEDEWEPKRIQRPKGLPEWGVPPTEPPPPSSTRKS